MDVADPRLYVHGVVAPDRSRAIFAVASTDSLYPDPPARLKLRGLDARPSLPRTTDPGGLGPGRPAATGLVGIPTGVWQEARRFPHLPRVSPDADFPGEVLTGGALEHVGLASPRTHPDQVVLYRADATEGAR